MPPPYNISELRHFMGMINQFGKFLCNLAQITEPLCELLQQRNSWMWGQAQEESFAHVKAEIAKPTVLALFDVNADVKVSADASSFGLGAALLQKTSSSWQPVAFASRVMSDTQRHYAQVEKEALAITWACGRFSTYILGKVFTIETDAINTIIGWEKFGQLAPQNSSIPTLFV